MTRRPWACAVLLVFAAVALAGAGERRADRSGRYSYEPPDGWTVSPVGRFKHDSLRRAGEDGKARNVVVNDQPGSSPLDELRKKYERDLPKALKKFRLVSSRMVDLGEGRQAARIVHTNEAPGVPVRQVNYILDVGRSRYFVACTVLEGDGEAHDAAFEAFVKSLKAEE